MMATDSITLKKICQNKCVKAIWREFSMQNLLPSLFPRFDCWRDVRNVIVECPLSDTQLCFINTTKASGLVGQRKSALLSSLFIRNFQNKSGKKFLQIFSKFFFAPKYDQTTAEFKPKFALTLFIEFEREKATLLNWFLRCIRLNKLDFRYHFQVFNLILLFFLSFFHNKCQKPGEMEKRNA